MELQDYFPYDTIRPQQQQIIDKLKLCKDKKYIIIEAMPGTGKSAIATMLASYSNSAYIFTATKQLQDQYSNEFPDIVSIKGKINYHCAYDAALSCKYASCSADSSIKSDCIKNGLCPYYRQKHNAVKSHTTLSSYAYFFTFMKAINDYRHCADSKTGFKARERIIFDEAHLLESELTNWATLKLNTNKLNMKHNLFDFAKDDLQLFIDITMNHTESGYTELNEQYLKAMLQVISMKRDAYDNIINDLMRNEGYQYDAEFIDTSKKLNELTDIYKRIKLFFAADDKENWIIEPNDNGEELILQPIHVNTLFNDYISKCATKQIIFMSATILNARIFCEELGITKDEVGIIRIDSAFDPNKSPIYYKPVGKMNIKALDSTMPNIIKAIKIVLNEHPNEKGIIHTGNYKIAHEIIKNIHDDRLLCKTEYETNESLIKRHISAHNSVLVSPSLGTGTDLKDDLSRFQVIIKMPFKSLMDKQVKRKAEMNADWYACDMLRAFIQSSGRSTRSESDYSTTYVLDSSFGYWILKYKAWLPKQFMKRIIWH